jgi:hypothetical protein
VLLTGRVLLRIADWALDLRVQEHGRVSVTPHAHHTVNRSQGLPPFFLKQGSPSLCRNRAVRPLAGKEESAPLLEQCIPIPSLKCKFAGRQHSAFLLEQRSLKVLVRVHCIGHLRFKRRPQ